MSDALLKVRQHFANFRSPEKLVEIKVPEWDMSIWYWPHLSIGERRQINMAANAGVTLDETEAAGRTVRLDRDGRAVMELIARSRDEHGRPLFHESQFDLLLKEGDPAVIERITSEMRDEYSDPETVEKN